MAAPLPPLRIDRPEDFAPYGEVLSRLGIGVTLVDRGMQVRWANDWIHEYAEELTLGNHCFVALWKSHHRCADCLPLLVFRTGEAQEGVRERARPDDPMGAYRVRAVPVHDARGELAWVAETFLPLADLAPDLAGRHTRLASEAAAASAAAMVVVDAEERIVSWNQGAQTLFGHSIDEALGRRIDLVVPEDLQDEERALAETVRREGRAPRLETVRLSRDGRRVPVALTAVAVRDERGELVGRSCAVEDLSALQQLRERLATQEQLLAHISREAVDAIVGVDLSGRITSWNRGAEKLLGLTPEAAVGRSLGELAGEADLGRLLERVRRRGAVRGLRMDWRDAAGEEVPVDVSAARLEGQGAEGVALVARDLSARLRLDRQLMRSEKLAVVGSLAAGLAHEIGTPLNVISATAEYLMLDSEREEQRAGLEGIVGETERISRLVKELLSFARGGREGRVAVHLDEAVERVRSLLRIPLERKGLTLEVDLDPALPPVDSEPDGLHQILLNLVLNASQAVGEGGRIGVRARAEAGLVSVEVHDDGPGVPAEARERIFDPFFTTRADGTGLGLAVCARVVSTHGGDLQVADGPWGGASFVVQLPVHREDAGAAA